MSNSAQVLKEISLNQNSLPNNFTGQCFGCAKKNPIGLKLQFWYHIGKVFTFYTIPKEFSGFQGLGHGGIIATLLDEISAWTIAINLKTFGITQSFALTYLKPVPIDTDILIEGIIASNEKSHIIIHAHIKALDDKILVESNSTWSLLDKKTLAKVLKVDYEDLVHLYKTFFGPIELYLENLT